jgi:hypothetical protein
VCNNSPAESHRPENGWRSSSWSIITLLMALHMHVSLPDTWPFNRYNHLTFSTYVLYWTSRRLAAYGYTYTLILINFFNKTLYIVSIEEVLVRDLGASHSADLGTSSKESYWELNRGWPKRRKVPCCSLVRRGWVSPKLMAGTALKLGYF